MVIPAAWSLQRWTAPGAKPFFTLGIIAAAWTLTEAGAQLSQTAEWQIFFDKLSYVSAYTPLVALFLALDYQSKLNRLRLPHLIAIFSIPTLTLLFAFTNDYHHLIWTQYSSVRVDGIRLLNVKYGPWFWVFETYATTAALGGTVLLARTLWTSSKLQRSQSLLIAAGILVSWIANTAYDLRLGPWPGLDLTPIGCAVCAILCVFSLHRYRLFDLTPVAYDTVVHGLSDGVIVVDNQRRITFLNDSAAAALHLNETNVGDTFLLPFRTPEGLPERDITNLEPCEAVACEIDLDGFTRYYELTVSPLVGKKWNGKSVERGRVLLLHDVTSKQVQQFALELSQDELVRSNEMLSGLNGELEDSVACSARLAEEAARAKSFVERILTATPNIVYIYDPELGHSIYVNGVVVSTLGYSPEKVMRNRNWMRSGVHPEDREKVRLHLAECLDIKDGEILELEYRARHANGEWRWMLSRHCVFTRDASGRITQILGTASDITRRRHTESMVREQEERWQLALHGNSEGLWDWDIAKGQTYRSAGWKRMLGYEEHEIGNAATEWTGMTHPDDEARVEFEIREHLDGKTAQFVSEYRMRAKDGSWRWIFDRGRCIRNDQGRAVRMAGSQTDITDRKLLEQRLATEALMDPLTGLPNRRHLLAQLEEAFRRAKRDGVPLSVAIGDIDRFKAVNDTYGHAMGDRVLISFAEILRPCLRATDFAGRLGGDEFCIFFPRSSAGNARKALERVRTQLGQVVFSEPGRKPFQVSISFGIAELQNETESSRLLEAADRRLYRAKQEGRNRTIDLTTDLNPPATMPHETIN
jgi:diguanylate cyclase (GGDEF)-like protein/PAS domain S-box-containing protein